MGVACSWEHLELLVCVRRTQAGSWCQGLLFLQMLIHNTQGRANDRGSSCFNAIKMAGDEREGSRGKRGTEVEEEDEQEKGRRNVYLCARL